MTQSQDDQAQPKPKKHRMTFAEWRATNPVVDPEAEEHIRQICEYYHTVLAPAFQKFYEESQRRHAEERNPHATTQTGGE